MKKNIIIIIITAIITTIICCTAFYFIRNLENINDDSKYVNTQPTVNNTYVEDTTSNENQIESKTEKEKGYELFGNEHCSGHEPITFNGWPSYSTCKICGIKKFNDVPYSDFIICPKCSNITGRCTKCGKLLENKE